MRVDEKIGKLGKPSLIFGPGQQRRLNLVKKYINLKNQKILDVGCGIGIYAKKFKEEGAKVFGVDIDPEKVALAQKGLSNIKVASAEKLPFKNNFFDIVFLHEILEHVSDDKKTIEECLRVLKSNGQMIIFVPNRLYPFETHGIYLGKKYVYQLIPFINWLPRKIRNFFCPHVRVYTVGSLKNLFQGKRVNFVVINYVYPALDRFTRHFPKIGRYLRKFFDFAENNWLLRHFGISIFMVVRKT